MPIDKDVFKKATQEASPEILEFLNKNRDKAYTYYEIMDGTGFDYNQVIKAIARLSYDRKVESAIIKGKTYWTVKG